MRDGKFGFVLLALLLVAMVVFLIYPDACVPKRPPRTIMVDGVECQVELVVTGRHCSSHGLCTNRGYDKAVCPPKEK